MAQVDFVQTDNAPVCTGTDWSAPNPLHSVYTGRLCTIGAAAGSGSATFWFFTPPGSPQYSIYSLECPLDGYYPETLSTVRVGIHITAITAFVAGTMGIRAVYAFRVNPACGEIALLSSNTGINLTTVGTHYPYVGSFSTFTPAAGEKIEVVVVAKLNDKVDSHSGSVTIKFDSWTSIMLLPTPTGGGRLIDRPPIGSLVSHRLVYFRPPDSGWPVLRRGAA